MLSLKTTRSALLLCTACMALVLFSSSPYAWSQSSPQDTSTTVEKTHCVISSPAELDQLVSQLEQPRTRLDALSTLAHFASLKLYRVGSILAFNGDANIDALQTQAAQAIQRHTDLETVTQALNAPDRTLQFWGVWFWRKGAFKARGTFPNLWLSLLPKIEKLATEGDSNVRLFAVQGLQWYPTENTFLKNRFKAETSPSILWELKYLDQGNAGTLEDKFNVRLLRLLNHPDQDVRREALLFIGSNLNSAPVWQVRFSALVAEKVRTMTTSKTEEKKEALFALAGLQKKL